MPYVENQFIFREVETIVQCNDYFGNAEVGSKMTAVFVDYSDNTFSDFVRKRPKFLYIQFFHVCRRFNVIEQHKRFSILL